MSDWIEGKVILVTGAGRRIGRAIALDLAAHGASIGVHVHRSVEQGEETAEQCRAIGARAAVVVANQAQTSAVKNACRKAEEVLGAIDGLVNSAAIWPKTPFEETSEADYEDALNTNLRGPFFFAQALAVGMRQRGDGAIVNIADVSTDRPFTDAIPYTMAKSGLVTMTYSLAKALAPHVRVNCVSPGPIEFPADYDPVKAQQDIAATLLRRTGCSKDVTRAVRYCLNATYVTGTVLPVDGGFRFGI